MKRDVPSFAFDTTSKEMDKLASAGTLQDAGAVTGLARFAGISADHRFLMAAGVGLVLVLLLNWARLRWNWWPLHPVLFLVWATVPMAHFAPSFLLGWMVRSAVVRLGGGRGYQKIKPLMYGLIAGDLLGGMLFMGVGVVYYLLNNVRPKLYQIFPY